MRAVAIWFLAVMGLVEAVSSGADQEPAERSFAYKVVAVSSPTDERTLNQYGKDGWELVTVVQDLMTEGRFFLYFRRDRKVDRVDLPFAPDPSAVGTWEAVDFVKNIAQFVPDQRQSQGELFLKQMVFLEGGRTPKSWETWTKGVVMHQGDRTASKYVLREVAGSTYMFLEWKSGDYFILHRKPWYYVLRKKQE